MGILIIWWIKTSQLLLCHGNFYQRHWYSECCVTNPRIHWKPISKIENKGVQGALFICCVYLLHEVKWCKKLLSPNVICVWFQFELRNNPSGDPPPSPPPLTGQQAGKQAGHRVSPRKPARCLSTVMGHLKSVSTLPNCLLTRCHRNCVKSSAGGKGGGGGEKTSCKSPKLPSPAFSPPSPNHPQTSGTSATHTKYFICKMEKSCKGHQIGKQHIFLFPHLQNGR